MPPVSKSVPRIPYPPKVNNSNKQGIGTILRTEPEKAKSGPASLRRTLSADMSSKKWLEQNGFPFAPAMKKIASFKELAVNHHPDSSSSSESEDEERNRTGRDDIWRSIQQGKESHGTQMPNIWGSLVRDQKEDQSSKSVYVHPLVKRSTSTLSEKSLEICTESLGSETGSDCFTSYPGSEASEDENVERQAAEPVKVEYDPFEDFQVKKYKFSPVRPFPPPIPSIAGGDGASLQMHSKRENGRLVLEAVTVPVRNCFHAERRDGRLVLMMMNSPNEEVEENKGGVFGDMEELGETENETENVHDGGYYEDEEEEEDEKVEETKTNNIVKEFELVKSSRSSGMISVHKSGLMMKKLVAQGNQNPTWTKKVVNMIVEDEGLMGPQSLPQAPLVARLIPSPPNSAAASFNAYDYFWRKNTVATPKIADVKSMPIKNYNTKINGANQDLVIIKEKKPEHFAPYVRACKDGRRSLLIWEPYCIATS